MMKEGGVSHQNNEYHPYANGNMQHIYNNSRQTPDSGLGNEDSRNSMNNAGGGGDNSGAPTGGGRVPPGFAENPYFVGNSQQSQYNDQHQHQYRPKYGGGGHQDGGRFDRPAGPPSIMTMPTSPPNMDHEGGPSYNPNYGNYPQYPNQGGPPYGGIDRNFNAPHPMATRSHSNFSESSSINMASGGGPPDPSSLSGQPLMAAGPHGGMMYPSQGGLMGHPYPHPHMQQQQHIQQGGPVPYMLNPAAHAAMVGQQHHAQMMQGGPPMMQQCIPVSQHGHQGSAPPQSVSPPQPMMMMQVGPLGGPMHPAPLYYPQHTMMQQRAPVVSQTREGYVQFTYQNPHAQQQGGYAPPMRVPYSLQPQRSLNSPAPSDNTDGQSIQGGPSSIGVWNGPPDQQSQHSTTPPSGMQPMQQPPHPMQPPQMQMQPFVPIQLMTASYPGAAGPFPGPPGGPRLMTGPNAPPLMQPQMQQMNPQGMPPMQQMQPYAAAGGFPPQQHQSGYWTGPQGGRGGYHHRGGRGGGSGRWSGSGGGGSRPGSRNYQSRTTMNVGGRSRGSGGDMDESKCTTPTEDDIIDVTGVTSQMDSMGMGDQSMVEGGGQGSHSAMPQKQLLELADPKSSSSPPAEPHPTEEECEIVPQEMQQQHEPSTAAAAAASVPIPTTPRSEPRKELLEMKKTPKHEADKSSSQSIPVDPVPPHGATAPARTWSEVAAKPSCVYCRGKQLPVDQYTSHNLRNGAGVVECPLFRKNGCTFCGAAGDDAHDAFFCEQRIQQLEGGRGGTGDHHHHHHHEPSHDVSHAHHDDREGGYKGGMKRGGGGAYYHKGRGGDRKYDNRRVQ